MKRRRVHPVHVVDVVRHLIGGQEIVWRRRRKAPAQTMRVFAAFEALGPPFVAQAQPESFRRGVLTLSVGRSAWLTELSMLSERVVERLNENLGEPMVKQLRLRLGSMPARSIPKIAPRLNARQSEVVRTATELGDNDKLRQAIERAATRSLARTRQGRPADGPPGPRVCPPTPPPEEGEAPLTYGFGASRGDRWDPDRGKWKGTKS